MIVCYKDRAKTNVGIKLKRMSDVRVFLMETEKRNTLSFKAFFAADKDIQTHCPI